MKPDQTSTNSIDNMLRQKGGRFLETLFFLAAAVAAFFLSGTALPGPDLDQSWQVALEYASRHQLQFGTDIVFTYGPLNYLNLPFSRGFLLPERAVFAVIWSAVAAASATMVAFRLELFPRVLFMVWFLVFSVTGELEQHVVLVIACGGLLLLKNSGPTTGSLCWLVTTAVLSLIKFNFCVMSVITIVVIGAVHLLRRNFGTAILVPAVYSASVLLLWTLCGQSLAAFPHWIRGSFEIVAGYSEAMALPPGAVLFSCCLALVLLYLTAFGTIVRSCRRDRTAVACLLLLAVYLFFSWKHGMVRAGGGLTYNFAVSVPLLFGLLRVIPNARLTRLEVRLLDGLYLLTVAMALVTAGVASEGEPRRRVKAWPEEMAGNLKKIFFVASGRPDKNYAHFMPEFKLRREPDLPVARSLVGNRPVDVLNCLQWAAFANGLDYRPRPVIQGYAAYTPYLQRLNLDFFRSGRRPEFLLFNPETIDDRLETLDDAAALPFILRNYRLVGRDGDFTILRAADSITEPDWTYLAELTTGFGRFVDLSARAGSTLAMTVEMEETVAGRIRKLLYQPPVVLIRLHTGNGIVTRRFVPSMGREGFIISPVVSTADDVVSFYRGEGRVVHGFEFTMRDRGFRGYADRIRVRIFRLELEPNPRVLRSS